MQTTERGWTRFLPNLLVILAVLLVILSAFGVIYVVYEVLHRFGQVLFLFGLGAILAYVLTPFVNLVQHVTRLRSLAVLTVYLILVAVLVVLGVLLFRPFVEQSKDLVTNLQNPSANSLNAINAIQIQTGFLQTSITDQAQGSAFTPDPTTEASIGKVENALVSLGLQSQISASRPARTSKNGQKVVVPTQVPPSYLEPVLAEARTLQRDYASAAQVPSDTTAAARAVADARRLNADVGNLKSVVSSTAILVLRAQAWIDQQPFLQQHGIKANLRSSVGKGIQELNDRAASLLNNAVGILSKAANVLLDTIFVLIISIYFLSDGGRIIDRGVNSVPGRYRTQAQFFVQSANHVLGGYLRGQLLLAGIAGILGGVGAAVLGVPYAVLIGMSTFLLELVPVIGPLILILPPLIISLVFTPFTTAAILLIYFIVFQQIVTNVIGPRIIGTAVGIHPLIAMAAALVGYPLAGFLGSFLAVPVVGIMHIAIREARQHFAEEEARAAEAAQTPSQQPMPPRQAVPEPPV